jgi:hypothetical protein
MRSLVKRVILVSFFILLVTKIGIAFSQDIQNPSGRALRILFIGNSLTERNNLPIILQNIAYCAGYAPPVVTSASIGGYSLMKHLKSEETLKLIDHRSKGIQEWDVVILQESARYPAQYDITDNESVINFGVNMTMGEEFLMGVRELTRRILQGNPHARVILYETWADYRSLWINKDVGIVNCGKDPVEMQSRTRMRYQEVQDHLNNTFGSIAMIAPVGDAWEKNYQSQTPLLLHEEDGHHPNIFGSYLAGLILFKVIYGVSPEKTTYSPPGQLTKYIDFLKKTAGN